MSNADPLGPLLAARLRQDADKVLSEIGKPGCSISDMARHFPDPKDLFIMAPQPIDVRTLAQVYRPNDMQYVVELRGRAHEERWREARAIAQSERSQARRDAMIETEASVWAMMAADFHMQRVRGLFNRWELLSSLVLDNLQAVETGRRPFDSGLRDACKELRDVESAIEKLMPSLSLTDRASETWNAKRTSRNDMINDIASKLRNVASGEAARQVFAVIEGGLDGDVMDAIE